MKLVIHHVKKTRFVSRKLFRSVKYFNFTNGSKILFFYIYNDHGSQRITRLIGYILSSSKACGISANVPVNIPTLMKFRQSNGESHEDPVRLVDIAKLIKGIVIV